MVRTNGKKCSAAEALCMVDMRSAVDRNGIDLTPFHTRFAPFAKQCADAGLYPHVHRQFAVL